MCTINLDYLILYILFPWFIEVVPWPENVTCPKSGRFPKTGLGFYLNKKHIYTIHFWLKFVKDKIKTMSVMFDKCIVTFSPSMTYLLRYLRCKTITYTFGPNSGRSAIAWASSLFLSCWDCNRFYKTIFRLFLLFHKGGQQIQIMHKRIIFKSQKEQLL